MTLKKLKNTIINIIEEGFRSDTQADKIIDLFLIIKCDRCGEMLTEFGGLAFSPPLNDKHAKTHLCRDCWKLFEVWVDVCGQEKALAESMTKKEIQGVIMKVKKCPDPICHKGIVILPMMNRNRGIRMKHIPCKGTGTIKEPLTLADIDFTGEIKLKGGWRVDKRE